ncbi:hypothetical protein [Piscibacillus salipiscarius]|uniref:hypothetical protein n=1 Tax=Piscibacillus salipiscarius TaxID=299480 RepID=UPI0006D1351E|nr:hypothetical protein [Piscibacillus salipiscarius]
MLANDTIDNLYIYDLDRIRNGNQLFIFIFIVTVIGIVLIDKFVRYWTGIPKVEREELPKPYKIMTNVLSVGVTIFTTFFMQSISLGDFWKVLALFVLFYFLAQIILQFIYLRSAKEYRVSLINLVIILLTITVLSYQFPYPLH